MYVFAAQKYIDMCFCVCVFVNDDEIQLPMFSLSLFFPLTCCSYIYLLVLFLFVCVLYFSVPPKPPKPPEHNQKHPNTNRSPASTAVCPFVSTRVAARSRPSSKPMWMHCTSRRRVQDRYGDWNEDGEKREGGGHFQFFVDMMIRFHLVDSKI